MAGYSPDSTDGLLVEGCLAGHRLAQKYLYERYFGHLMTVALRYVGKREEALPVLNQAFLKVLDSLPRYRGEGPLRAWMTRIVVHTAVDEWRSRKTYHNRIALTGELEEHPIDNPAVANMDFEYLLALVHRLPDPQRAVFNLFVIDGRAHKEIAQLLGMDESTSKWHLMQARRRLQKMIEAQKSQDKIAL